MELVHGGGLFRSTSKLNCFLVDDLEITGQRARIFEEHVCLMLTASQSLIRNSSVLNQQQKKLRMRHSVEENNSTLGCCAASSSETCVRMIPGG